MDIRSIVIASLDRVIASGVIEAALEKTLAETLTRTLSHELSGYSDFGKQLTEAFKQSLQLQGNLDLPSYNHAILAIVRKQVETATHATIQREVASRLEELLEPAPQVITLTELVDKYKEQVTSHAHAGCVCYGEEAVTVRLRESDGKWRYLSLSGEADAPKHAAQIEIGLCPPRYGELPSREEGWQVFSLRFGSSDVEKEMFAGPFYGFERLLFQMKAAKSKLVFDVEVEDLDLTYNGHL